MTTLPQPHDDAVSSGTAGASARREYEARRHRDEQRLRQRWGRLGGVAVALSDERQSTTAWKRGAVGEELLGARLDTLVPHGCAVSTTGGSPVRGPTSTTSSSPDRRCG